MKRPDDEPGAPAPQPVEGAAARASAPPAEPRHLAESEGWFTVARAAQLLGLAIPRIFDRIRDGKLQVRFESLKPGEPDRPFVTSPELKQRAAEHPAQNGLIDPALRAGGDSALRAGSAPAPSAGGALPSAAALATPAAPPRPMPAAPPAVDPAQLEELRRQNARLQSEARELREEWDSAEARLDTALKTIYERDVKIARLEAETGSHAKVREEGEVFIRHLESRLDRTEARNDEKEREIRRLAVGLGEAHSELRLLKPPAPEPPKLWKRIVLRVLLLIVVFAGAGVFGWVAWQLAQKSLPREAGIAAGAGVLFAFTVGLFLDRLRRTK